MKRFGDALRELRRLRVLELLVASTERASSAVLVATALSGEYLEASLDAVNADFAWLEMQGLVELREVGGHSIAKLRQRGVDVAAGTARVPGVARPSLG